MLSATVDQAMGRSKNPSIVEPPQLVNKPQTHFAKLRLGSYSYEHNGHYVSSLDPLDISSFIRAAIPEQDRVPPLTSLKASMISTETGKPDWDVEVNLIKPDIAVLSLTASRDTSDHRGAWRNTTVEITLYGDETSLLAPDSNNDSFGIK